MTLIAFPIIVDKTSVKASWAPKTSLLSL
jgi:hypothetical protein